MPEALTTDQLIRLSSHALEGHLLKLERERLEATATARAAYGRADACWEQEIRVREAWKLARKREGRPVPDYQRPLFADDEEEVADA